MTEEEKTKKEQEEKNKKTLEESDAKTKKELTHKRVRISVGATCLPNTYREVWVKK
jgi:hypothetical protein